MGLVPLVPLDGKDVLTVREWANVPSDVVTPTSRLDPVNTSGIDVDKISWSLHESVARDSSIGQFLHAGPPRTMEIVDTVTFAESLQCTPVFVGHTKPLGIARAYVNVYGTEVVVFLMPGSPCTRNLHVKLHGVHAQNLVTHVRQDVAG